MNTVAKTILAQLGGNRFVAMTGASSFAYSENALTFRVGSNSKKIKAVRIELNGRDLYDMTFFKMGRFPNPGAIVVAEHADIFCEDLRDIFEAETDLLTSL